jgi:diguanylate cyclase (GGDEF)-like protein/PAS domain S-box-containing protein
MRADSSDLNALRAAAFAALPGASVFALDRELRILLAEGQALTQGGYQPEGLIGRQLVDVIPAAAYEKIEPEYRLALQGESRAFEHVVPESQRGYLVNVAPLRDDAGEVEGVVVVSQDITGRRRMEQELVEARSHFETAFTAAPIGMAMVGLDGRFLRANKALCELLGYDADEITTLTFQQITHPDDLETDLGHVDQLIAGEIDTYTMEKRYFTKEGHLIWVLLAASLVRDDEGNPLHFISQIRDISERKRMTERLKELAEHDSVTDLYNRRRFEEELARQVSRCQRYGETACLLVLDVDSFKGVNDRYGHKLGDAALRFVARMLRQRLRAGDVIARIGGDEFAAVLPGASTELAVSVAEELRESIRDTPVGLGSDQTTMTVSIGLQILDENTPSDQEAFVAADKAMYRAKAAGRDMVVAAD